MHRRQRGFDGGAAFAQRMRTCVVGAAAGGSGACVRSASVIQCVEGQVPVSGQHLSLRARFMHMY